MGNQDNAPREGKNREYSPREFLKSRRPERFSDSISSEQPVLDRSILEYELETLTNRNQEAQFATFARHIAEREICPNLLPQTGPTGGGDSKVDSETYPVAEVIALGWYTGIASEAASDRWGFAFSAKKKWRDKLESDIAKAVETGRGYKKVFFITNQFVRDKDRAEQEDKLTRKHDLDVRILDRNWILERVFKNGHENIAIADLQLQTSTRKTTRKGPLDTKREAELEALESRIQEQLTLTNPPTQVAEDCINAADLARQLEKPRAEVDGLYERAERIAVRYGTEHQRFICAYQRAWTTYWWYEDYDRFNELYETAEQRATGIGNAYILELQTNLWTLLHNAVLQSKIDEQRAAHDKRTRTLSKEIEKLAQREDQPSAALHARALKLQISLLLEIRTQSGIDQVLRDFQDIFRKCEGLAGFPFEPLAEMLIELGDHIGHLSAYDELFGTLIEIQTERKKEMSAAQLLLRRGTQQLQADRPYDAIRSLGLSLSRLYTHESRWDAVTALYLCGCAYEQVGLLWAARGTLLSAASLATIEFYKYGDLNSAQAACYRTLKWVDLQLGRVAQALSWHQIDIAVRQVMADGKSPQSENEWEIPFDGTLGMLLLKTDPWEFKYLAKLPETLERLGLFNAWAAVMYALGDEDELKKAQFPSSTSKDELNAYFLQWRDHPSAEELSAEPLFYEEQRVSLRSNILGCTVTIQSDNCSPCLELSESILAALESLLSTGTTGTLVAREPTLTINVRNSALAKSPFEFELEDSTGRPHINVTCPSFDAHFMSMEMQQQYKRKLFELLAWLMARVVTSHDLQQTLTRLFKDELAIDRSINFTGSFVTAANILGPNAKTRVSAWIFPNAREFVPKRKERWDAGDTRKEAVSKPSPLKIGQGEPPKDLSNQDRTHQREIQTVSLIREPLWEKAGWTGTAFVMSYNYEVPPILALAFKSQEAAHLIFAHWHNEFGSIDAQERMRLSIIRAINQNEPYSYRVAISSNPETSLANRKIRYAVFVCRSCTMNPTSPENLERFLISFNKAKEFYLAPALFSNGGFRLIESKRLLKKALIVKDAWQIGRNDLDSHAIYPDDSPIIPAGQTNPPVAELLRWKRSDKTKK